MSTPMDELTSACQRLGITLYVGATRPSHTLTLVGV